MASLSAWRNVLFYLGDFLVSPESPQPADLILVLGGDFWGERVVKGAELAKQGFAPAVLFSGTIYRFSGPPYQGQPEGQLAIAFLAQKGYPIGRFQTFLHQGRSTIEEATALRPELERRGVKRVLLVTSAYHSRRAGIVFRLFCPGIQFIAIGAPEPNYHANCWWEDPSSEKLFYSEWTKILGTVLIAYPTHLVENLVHGS